MDGKHWVSVSGDRLYFSAAHMATIGDRLEPLHGHNYAVTVEVHGDLTEDGWVWDFGDLKREAAGVLETLDHRFILQTESRSLAIGREAATWTIRHGDRSYSLPVADVVPLPIDNSTAERIAEWIAGQLGARLAARAGRPVQLTVGVSESPEQSGWYTVAT